MISLWLLNTSFLLVSQLLLLLINVVYGALVISLPFVTAIPTAGRYLYAIWVIVIYACISGNFVVLPVGISKAFGHKYFASNNGIVFSAFVSKSDMDTAQNDTCNMSLLSFRRLAVS